MFVGLPSQMNWWTDVHLEWNFLYCWTLCTKFSNSFFSTCCTSRHQWPVTNLFHFQWPWSSCRSLGQWKTKHVVVSFLHTSDLIRMRFCVVLNQIKPNLLIPPRLRENYLVKRKQLMLNWFSLQNKKLVHEYGFRCLWTNFFHTWWYPRLESSLNSLDLQWRPQGAR